MLLLLFLVGLAACQTTTTSTTPVLNTPEQIHLSYARSGEMIVTWQTKNETSSASVRFGPKSYELTTEIPATRRSWTDGGSANVTRHTHRAIMMKLKVDSTYHYQVGGDGLWSPVYKFKALGDTSQDVKFAVFGDMGQKQDNVTIPALKQLTLNGDIDIVFHIGDIAYDLDSHNGNRGDEFMNNMQDISTRVPYMVLAGNHEISQNFLHYRERYTMPPNGVNSDNQFWSITLGPAQIIGLSSEYYGFNRTADTQTQFNWLVKTMKNVVKPWLIVMLHRPLYCSDHNSTYCNDWENIILRYGLDGMPGLEKPFNIFGADLVYSGHRHTYERLYPVYNNTPYIQDDPQNYHNAPTPVYTVTGAAGCHSHEGQKKMIPAPYSAKRLKEFGFNIVHLMSNTEIHQKFVNTNSTLDKLDMKDKFWLTKDAGFRPGGLVRFMEGGM